MKTFLSFFDLVPGWVWALVCAGMLTTNVVQWGQVQLLRVEVAEKRAQAAEEVAAREKAAREWLEAKSTLVAAHAVEQQTKEAEYAKTIKTFEEAARVRAADNQRLRGKLAEYTRGDGATQTDSVACVRDRNRLKALGSVVDEGLGLVQEARSIIERRDAEVNHLKGLLVNDRGLLGSSPHLIDRQIVGSDDPQQVGVGFAEDRGIGVEREGVVPGFFGQDAELTVDGDAVDWQVAFKRRLNRNVVAHEAGGPDAPELGRLDIGRGD